MKSKLKDNRSNMKKEENFVEDKIKSLGAEIQSHQVSAKKPAFEILDSYLTDLSLENPLAPNIFYDLQKADASNTKGHLDYNLSYRNIENDIFELRLKMQLELKYNEKKVYILEIEYGSVVRFLAGLSSDAMALIMYVEVAKALFPFVRSQAMQVLQTANLPIRNIQIIDFFAIYRAKLERGELEAGQKAAKA